MYYVCTCTSSLFIIHFVFHVSDDDKADNKEGEVSYDILYNPSLFYLPLLC